MHIEEFTRNLKILLLQNKYIIKINNNAFHNLHNLEKLNLANNLIKKLDNITFTYLIHLSDLHLEYNQISLIERNSFKKLIRLKFLYLFNNKITKITNDMFSGLSEVSQLYLNNNKLTEIENSSFSELVNMNLLNINRNIISKLDLNVFKNNTNLKEIFASHNKITSLIGNISFISSLNDIYINDNSISSIKLIGLRDYLSKNESIYLINNRVDIIFNCHHKWILEINQKRSFNFISGNLRWIIDIDNAHNLINFEKRSFKSLCLFQYFNNQNACGREKIMFNNLLSHCNNGNLFYFE